MSGSNCCFLTCIQVSQEAAEIVWYPHLLKNFLQVVVILTEAEVEFFLLEIFGELLCFFSDPMDVGNLISSSSVFSKSSLNIWKFSVHVLLKPSLKDFEHVKWEQLCGSLSILWHCLSLVLEWKLTFSSPTANVEFSKFADILSAAL